MLKKWALFSYLLPKNEDPENLSQSGQEGQAFIEFVLLMAITFALAYTFFNLSNKALSLRWREMVNTIVSPSQVNFY